MIERYSRPLLSQLWSEEAKLRTWLDIEVLACEAWYKLGKIPTADWKLIQEKASFDLAEVLEKEKETKHDVAAFVSVVQENIGPAGRFIHVGITSSDIVDTAFSYRLKKSGELILKELGTCLEVTRERALKEKNVLMIGRTHGIHAEPMTMGLKWLLWHDALLRSSRRLEVGIQSISVGKISGAVGTYAHTPPDIEKHVCQKLGLRPDSLSTQVISRDRYAEFFAALGLLGSTVEGIVTELRHLQRTEVAEVREGFSKGQKGSSAMPHKRNPITAENLTGLARLLRSYTLPAMENIALWHERDISHSSVERVIGPDATILADYMLSRLGNLLTNLEIFPEQMMANLNKLQGVVFSQRVLLALIDHGLSRDEAYEIVQKNALKALDAQRPFRELILAEPTVAKALPKEAIDMLFDAQSYVQNLDYIYKKVLEPGA